MLPIPIPGGDDLNLQHRAAAPAAADIVVDSVSDALALELLSEPTPLTATLRP